MRQILQNPRTGALELCEVPAPQPAAGQVLVRNAFSVVSPGTDKVALDFARKSLLGKARSRPDLVRQVTRKLRQEGPLPTWRAVFDRLDAPQPLGYSSAGVVEAVGAGVTRFAPGDRVACAGAGYANHAELVVVPENLAVLVPAELPLQRAAFATLGAIALQGLRVAAPTLGELGVVIGLGLIGQLCVQLLRANGCRAFGIDTDPQRVKQALEQGASWAMRPGREAQDALEQATGGVGADLALVTAASESSEPIRSAAELCRPKGRVVVVGATAMELDRRTFYEKELELRMSMSYGPGRYDRGYEELGLDYPISYVRWTENRNLEAFVQLAASGAVDPERLDHRVLDFAEAEQSYEALAQGERPALAVLFRYPAAPRTERTLDLRAVPAADRARREPGVAFLGAGNYAKAALLPALRRADPVRRVALVTATGASARRSAERYGFDVCSTDADAVLRRDDVDLVFVATRHDSHAELAVRALEAGKAVWLEKPMGIAPEQVDAVIAAARRSGRVLAVGYNRRFSPHAEAVREAFSTRRAPLSIHYTVAPGPPPSGTWITDPGVGGGRIVGEVCHFVDLCGYLVGAPATHVFARALGRDPETDDSTVAMLRYADGSVATIEYLASASGELPKERFEASTEGCTALCDNFRTTRILGRGARRVRTWNQDKGQTAAVARVVEAVRAGGASPFGLDELAGVSRAVFAIRESSRSGGEIGLD